MWGGGPGRGPRGRPQPGGAQDVGGPGARGAPADRGGARPGGGPPSAPRRGAPEAGSGRPSTAWGPDSETHPEMRGTAASDAPSTAEDESAEAPPAAPHNGRAGGGRRHGRPSPRRNQNVPPVAPLAPSDSDSAFVNGGAVYADTEAANRRSWQESAGDAAATHRIGERAPSPTDERPASAARTRCAGAATAAPGSTPARPAPSSRSAPRRTAAPSTAVGLAPPGAETWHRDRTSRRAADGGPATEASAPFDLDDEDDVADGFADLAPDADDPPAGLPAAPKRRRSLVRARVRRTGVGRGRRAVDRGRDRRGRALGRVPLPLARSAGGRARRRRAGHRRPRARRPRAHAQRRPPHHPVRRARRPLADGVPGDPRPVGAVRPVRREPGAAHRPLDGLGVPGARRRGLRAGRRAGLRRRRADGVGRSVSQDVAAVASSPSATACRCGPCTRPASLSRNACGTPTRSSASAVRSRRPSGSAPPPSCCTRPSAGSGRYAARVRRRGGPRGRGRRDRARRGEHVPGGPGPRAHRALRAGLRPHRRGSPPLHPGPLPHRGRGHRRPRPPRAHGRRPAPRAPRRRQRRPPRRAPRARPRHPALRRGAAAAGGHRVPRRGGRRGQHPPLPHPLRARRDCSPGRCSSPGCTCSPPTDRAQVARPTGEPPRAAIAARRARPTVDRGRGMRR